MSLASCRIWLQDINSMKPIEVCGPYSVDWRYSHRYQSISKVSPFIRSPHDGTIQRSPAWRTKSSCLCYCRCRSQSNPVLEAFDNAKTATNNNQAIRTYLLERSRVCQVLDPEHNYHCIYLLSAAPQKETSTRNSINRSKLRMPHRMGSKPIREIIYKLAKMAISQIWQLSSLRLVRKTTSVEPETNEKYAKIQELVQSESSLTNIEVVERCFEPQHKSHVVGFGEGNNAKELKDGNSSKAALLEKLNATEKKNESLKECMEGLENKCEDLESKYAQLASVVYNHASSSSSSEQ